MVDGQLQRIQRTLRELIGFSRPTNQQATAVDVHAAINEALNIAKYYKRWKGKAVATELAAGLPLIHSVYDQLVQVILNLVLNALDATEEGASITLTTQVLPADDAGPNRISILIRDEGHGISEAAQAQIFQPYFTTKSTGTGLGLFVCRQLVQQTLRGEIRLVSSSPNGTTFEVLLPVPPNPAG